MNTSNLNSIMIFVNIRITTSDLKSRLKNINKYINYKIFNLNLVKLLTHTRIYRFASMCIKINDINLKKLILNNKLQFNYIK